jgi:hypothetical protein
VKVPIPSREEITYLFGKLGTQRRVAECYDVSRATVLKWQRLLGLEIEYHSDIPRAQSIKVRLSKRIDRVRVAQWLCDEGSISTSYDSTNDNTYLAVSGQMVDCEVMEEIGRITNQNVNNGTVVPRLGWMPMGYVRLLSAEAYALLESIHSELLGLKRLEAEAALRFFPSCGLLHRRVTTDEFLKDAWRQFAELVVSHWNKKRQEPVSAELVKQMIDSWILSRTRRARYFRDGRGDAKPK